MQSSTKAPDLTRGDILRPLIRLALPFAVGHLASVLSLATDRLYVGRVGTEALAALGIAHAAMMMLLTLAMGMAVGTLAGVARSIGAGRPREAAGFFGQGTVIGVGIGVLMVALSFVLPQWVMAFMGAESAVSQPATEYLQISMAGLLFNAPLFMLSFSLQGAGEARAALLVSIVAPLVNVVLDPIFIFTLDLGLPGAAWATMVSLICALGLGYRLLYRSTLPIRIVRRDLRLSRPFALRIVKVGVPGTLEHLVRNVASFGLVKLLAGFGAVVLSAYTTAMVMLIALVLPGLALGQATASLVGQNLGAGRPHRAWKTAWLATGLYVGFMSLLGALIYWVAAPLIGVFDPNPAVVAEGARLLRIIVFCFPLIAVALVLGKAFGGAGRTVPAMMAAAAAHLLFQLPAVYFLGKYYGPTGAYYGMAGAFILHGSLSALLFAIKLRPTGEDAISPPPRPSTAPARRP